MKARNVMVVCLLGACGEVQGTIPDAANADAAAVDAPASTVDTDGDGLTDAEEQAGYTIMVRTFGAATATAVSVTSDPTKVDTDGDGGTDAQEKTARTNPKLADTDDDLLTDAEEAAATPTSSPIDYDTDNNNVADGTERKGIVALYRLDGLVGGKLLDTSGLTHDATPSGAIGGFALATDRFNRAGRALYHPANGVNTGVNGWATVDVGAINATSWSLSLWVNTNAVTGQAVGQPGNFAFGSDVRIANVQTGSTRIGPTESITGGPNNLTDYPAGAWHHWVLVRDGVNITMYRDGAVAQTGTSAFTANTCTLLMLWGWSSTCVATPGGFNAFDGSLDDVRVWNRPLAAREVARLTLETASP